jgi:Fe-S-cluster-containing dehydrogenase component
MPNHNDPLYQIRRGGPPEPPQPWRSLAEHEGRATRSPAGEFPPGALDRSVIDRRLFMQLAATGLGAAGAGCTRDKPAAIHPYARRPAGVTPGVPSFYATSMMLDGYASGVLVESHEGRPTKIEPNREHPASGGGTTLWQQAFIRQLYDDHRARGPRDHRGTTTWAALLAHLAGARPRGGAGLRVLLEPTSSPLSIALLDRVRARFPEAGVTTWAPLGSSADVDGAALAFGQPLLPQIDLGRADVIVCLDADPLGAMPASTRHARAWAQRRRLEAPAGAPNRLYVVESVLSVTGGVADHRVRRRWSEIPAAAGAIAAHLPGLPEVLRAALAPAAGGDAGWAASVARDLVGRPPGRTLVIAGPRQPAAVHALVHLMNAALGNLGQTLTFIDPVLPRQLPGERSLPELVAEMRAGAVETLVVLDANPVATAPADLGFSAALARVPDSIAVGLLEDETGARCRWFGPALHPLESWGDGRAHDGTLSAIQPLIEPLVDARGAGEILATLAGEGTETPQRERLRGHWQRAFGIDERGFERALQLGLHEGSGFVPRMPAGDAMARGEAVARALAPLLARPRGGLELELHPSPTLHDGRFANNPWLLEQPEPFTKLSWDNAALVSVATARALGVDDEDVIELAQGEARVRAPVLRTAGMADDLVVVWLGHGRGGPAALAPEAGFDAYPLRRQATLWSAPLPAPRKLGGRHPLARSQLAFGLEGRPIALSRTLAEYRRDPDFTAPHKGPLPTLLPQIVRSGPQWAMSIDLSICTGCSACMIACQAENNLPVVGKANVLRHRQMHWLRIDTYFRGSPDDPRPIHQPMACQHCETAPCEYVCPVNATVHSPDGLNEMIYNRCVGTRFCSNNCPYKVRRFNWFDWHERLASNRGQVALQYNPEVTVRERGVMEKCTYCVQRIRAAEVAARIGRHPIPAGAVVTACQAACPTGAIQFGSLGDAGSAMVRWRAQDRSYAVLHELGTRPRTMYLARIDNPNPELG